MNSSRVRGTVGDAGDIVLGWLTKLAVVLGVLGVIGFDAIALVQVRFQAADSAQQAALAAADAWRQSKDVQAAYDAAYGTLDPMTESIDPAQFSVAQDGSVRLTLRRETTTMLVEKIGPAKEWAVATADGEARPAT